MKSDDVAARDVVGAVVQMPEQQAGQQQRSHRQTQNEHSARGSIGDVDQVGQGNDGKIDVERERRIGIDDSDTDLGTCENLSGRHQKPAHVVVQAGRALEEQPHHTDGSDHRNWRARVPQDATEERLQISNCAAEQRYSGADSNRAILRHPTCGS